MGAEKVKIREVGPRDGFQNEAEFIPTPLKLELIELLIESGLQAIEITSFVNPKRVPQFVDAEQVATGVGSREGLDLIAFAANQRGLERAVACGIQHVTTALTVSEELNRSNFNRGTLEMLEALPEMISAAKEAEVELEVTIGTAFGDGGGRTVELEEVISTAHSVAGMGVGTLTLGDTVGVGTPGRVRETFRILKRDLPGTELAAHFHDTRGMAVANALAAWDEGVEIFDSSFGRLGGCPFAPGATGNVATEELIYLFDGMGVETGVDIGRLLAAVRRVGEHLGRAADSDVARASLAESAG